MSVIRKGCKKLLQAALDAGGISVGLFSNDYTPTASDDDDGSDYEEPVWDGYDRVELTSWEAIVEDIGKAYADHSQVSITPETGAGGVVYGYFLWDDDDNYLIGAKRFATPLGVVPSTPILFKPRLIYRDPSVS